MIRFHDTMSREKREFVPGDPKRITLYVCGPTVYNRAHIGNARPAVVFDTLARLLRHVYGKDSVVHAANVTIPSMMLSMVTVLVLAVTNAVQSRSRKGSDTPVGTRL